MIMQSKEILELFNNAAWITKGCVTQRNAFRYWRTHNHNAPHESLAWDTETTGLSFGVPSILHVGNTEIKVYNIKVFGISLAIPTKDRIVLIWARLGTELFDEAVKLLGVTGQKVAHNSRYDLRVCKINNIKIAEEVHCTLTAARIYWDRRQRFGIQSLCEMFLPELSDWEMEVKSASRKIKSKYTRAGYPKNYTNYSFIPDSIMSRYSMTDSFLCLMLHCMIHPSMQDIYKEVYNREKKVLYIALGMEQQGLQYDSRRSLSEQRKLEAKVSKLETLLHKLADSDFNIKSPVQVLDILLTLEVPPKLLKLNDKLSTDKNLLEAIVDGKSCNKLALRFIKTLLDIRAIYKLLNSYLIPLRKRAAYNNGRIYCNINAADTRTGRMAVTDPGLQTIPRLLSRRKRKNPIRSCFVCRPGYWNYYFDYAQIEMIFYAVLIGDQRVIDAYNNNEDIYTTIAQYAISKENVGYIREHLGDPRQALKQLSLAVIYGAGVPGTAKILQIPKERAASLLHYYLEACPLVLEYRDRCKQELYAQGYIEDFFGRRYHIEPGQAYKAPNAVVQGSCAQILKIAIIQIDKYIKTHTRKAKLLFPSHDELTLERPSVHKETEKIFARAIVHRMQNIKQLLDRGLTIRVDVAKSTKSWEDKKELVL